MFAQERHDVIRKIIRRHQRIGFADLQRLVPVSPATLRRDLMELEQSGDLIRVHGGALDPHYARSEISFDERSRHNHAGKKLVATAAANLIPAGASVFVDAGSTCFETGRLLLRRADVRIITHSVALIAAALHAEAGLLCIGGELRKVSGALVGAGPLRALEDLHADFALLGTSGMNSEGHWTTELSEAEMKRAILDRSSRRIVLADSSKWSCTSTIRFATWNQITDLVTDGLSRSASDRKVISSHRVKVHVPASGGY